MMTGWLAGSLQGGKVDTISRRNLHIRSSTHQYSASLLEDFYDRTRRENIQCTEDDNLGGGSFAAEANRLMHTNLYCLKLLRTLECAL